MPVVRVALAGATGNLGCHVLKGLLDAGFHVTALSRKGGKSARLIPHLSLTIKEVDFGSVEDLTVILRGAEIVVSCLATSATGSQKPLIDASVVAGVKRFIPAEFGMDSQNPLCMNLPVCSPKVDAQRYLWQKSNSNPAFTYTAIANGLFLDWFLEQRIILNVHQHAAILYNGGDVPFSATLLSDVAKAVVGVIANQTETKNRVVYVHSALVTQNRLIQYAKDKDGMGWYTAVKDTESVRTECMAELTKGPGANVDAAMLGFYICACCSPEYGCDFSNRLDNKLLGVEELSEAKLRELVERFLR
ncbi:oxidoreductase CipA-like protein [Hypomontagnella submonticulosa]|nr:oxidoreductase CipA-like protein [Hypomontagnella submonticulosa]